MSEDCHAGLANFALGWSSGKRVTWLLQVMGSWKGIWKKRWSNWRRLKVEIPTFGWCIFLSGSPISTTTTPPRSFFTAKGSEKWPKAKRKPDRLPFAPFFRGELLNFGGGIDWREQFLHLNDSERVRSSLPLDVKREYFSGTVRWELVIICCFFFSW